MWSSASRVVVAVLASVLFMGVGAPSHEASSPREDDKNTVRLVIAEGVGADVKSAREDACRNAVRQAVGAYIESDVAVENDKLITDKIVSLSSGFVERIEPIPGSETKAAGLVRVRIKAHVRSDKLVNALKESRLPIHTTSKVVDGSSLEAQFDTKSDRDRASDQIIHRLLEAYPTAGFQVRQIGTETVERDSAGNAVVVVEIAIETAPNWTKGFGEPFCAALRASGRKSGTVTDRPWTPPRDGWGLLEEFEEIWRFMGAGGRFDPQTREDVQSSCAPDGSSTLASFHGVRVLQPCPRPESMPSNQLFLQCVEDCSPQLTSVKWAWFQVSLEEWKRWFEGRVNSTACVATVLDREGEVLGRDSFAWGVDWIPGYPNDLTITPGFRGSYNGGYPVFPEFHIKRRISIQAADVANIASIRVDLEVVKPAPK